MLRALATVLAVLAISTTAHAHPLVEEGRRRFGEADFSGALATLARALAADDLTAEDVIEALETRVLVYQALGDESGIDATLRMLAAVAPDHAFAPEVPPEVQRRFLRFVAARPGPLHVRARAEERAGSVVIHAEVDNDPDGFTRAARVHGRASGGVWRTAEGSLSVPLGAETDRVEWYAELIGPGGALLDTEGSRSAPRLHLLDGAGGEAGPQWWWLALGGAAVVGTVIVLAAVLASGEVRTNIDGPTLELR